MTKPADMTRDDLLAEVDRLATLNNELSQILNRNADTLQASAQQIQRDAVRQTAAIVREGGGVMPEELPEVEYYRDPDGKRADAYTSGIVTVPESRWSFTERIRQQGLAYLAIAQKLKEAGA